jgi:ubiquinone/menaquinone biosynthesis C-methylase UbiE
MTFEKITKKTYDNIAKHFATKRTYNWPPVKKFLKSFSNKKNLNLLDVGCGGGRTLQLAESLGFDKKNLVGVDYSLGQLKVTKNKGYIVKKNNMLKLNFENNSFDVITCIAALHHLLNNKEQLFALKEMKRVLKGKLILCNWFPQEEYLKEQLKKKKFEFIDKNKKIAKITYKTNSKKFDRYYYLFSQVELIDLCKAAGFKIISEEQFKGNFYLILE